MSNKYGVAGWPNTNTLPVFLFLRLPDTKTEVNIALFCKADLILTYTFQNYYNPVLQRRSKTPHQSGLH